MNNTNELKAPIEEYKLLLKLHMENILDAQTYQPSREDALGYVGDSQIGPLDPEREKYVELDQGRGKSENSLK